jgi:hypothetical protein
MHNNIQILIPPLSLRVLLLCQEVASRFVGEMFAAIAADSKSQRQGFSEITRACQTPGGINEQVACMCVCV